MAIRAMILRKKIADARNQIENLQAKAVDFDAARQDLERREAELTKAIEEASNEDEQKFVEDEAEKFEADSAALESDVAENEKDISESVEQMERELNEIEADQKRTVPPPPDNADAPAPKTKKKTGGTRTMFKCKSIRQMSIAERDELVNRDDTREFLAEIRAAISEKRGITGGTYTISDTIAGLIRENVIDYSKLYKHVRVLSLSGKGREIVMGTAPEAFWEECCDPIYELEQAISQVELDCYKVAGFIPLCNALLEDSDIDLLDEIVVSILQANGLAIDKAIIYGTGVKMPTGVVTAIDDDDALKLTNEVTIATASSTGVKLFQELVKAGGLCANAYARGEKVWAMNEATYTTLQAEALSIV